MRCSRWVPLTILFLVRFAHASEAQSFTGTGARTTEFFALEAGMAVFQLEYAGGQDDPLEIRLLDPVGQVVGRVARESGPFSGSRTVRIARDGQYLLDIVASGAWTIRIQSAEEALHDPFRLGRAAGETAAGEQRWPAGWMGRGLVGGLVAGPIGAGVAYMLAGRSGVSLVPPAPTSDAARATAFVQAYQEAFRERVRGRRREAALAGGIIGTGGFVFAAVAIANIKSKGSVGGAPPGGGTPFSAIPVP